MSSGDKKDRDTPFPPQNVSVHYYSDPVYATDDFCRYDENEAVEELTDKKEETAPDEPIESWGWINNAD